jgi:cytosine/uracil/thiamine/allantoin permease
MKNCCLWLNGVKIRHAEDIKHNFDIASLRGYFMGGSLVAWLYANGGSEEALRLEKTQGQAELNKRLEFTFGLINEIPAGMPSEANFPPWRGGGEAAGVVSAGSHFGLPYPTSGSFGSFGSFGSGSGSLGYGLHII